MLISHLCLYHICAFPTWAITQNTQESEVPVEMREPDLRKKSRVIPCNGASDAMQALRKKSGWAEMMPLAPLPA